MLISAGLDVSVDIAAIDEGEIKRALQHDGMAPADIAVFLAETKALRVAGRHREALIIGADQILVCNDVLFDKPVDTADALATLRALRGRTHRLLTAVAVVQNNAVIWHHMDEAELTMRSFSDAFLERYLTSLGDRVCETVGAYRLEGLGVQLFHDIRGSYFTILGLPLLPLLEFLRGHGVVLR